MKRKILSSASLVAFLCLTWGLCALVIWWAYDMQAFIRGGFYRYPDALSLVVKMGLIVTVLVGIVWLAPRRRTDPPQASQLVWNVAWKTVLILIAYGLIVVIRRQLWTPSQGISDSAMFLPFIGHVNGQFFSEFRWLSYLFVVVPIVGCLSGTLYYFRSSLLRSLPRLD
jgi:predicted neutral ceramidase superfamily lipid hydrolase